MRSTKVQELVERLGPVSPTPEGALKGAASRKGMAKRQLFAQLSP